MSRQYVAIRPEPATRSVAVLGVLTPHVFTHFLIISICVLVAAATIGLSASNRTPLSVRTAGPLHAPNALGLLDNQFIRIPILPTTITAQDASAGARAPTQGPSAVTVASRRATRTFLVDYRVVEGDNIDSIARRFGIPTLSLLASNDLDNAHLIQPGDVLSIPPAGGIVHIIGEGDTLGSIAELYSVEPEAIVEYPANGIANVDAIRIGQRLIVPNGVAPDAVVASLTTEAGPLATNSAGAIIPGIGFWWPTQGPIFTYFSGYHPGIDISPAAGTPLYATQGGRVVNTIQSPYGYGWYIDIDHGNGYMSRYAHVSGFAVGVGSVVGQGSLIGWVGNTGNSSGPHVHFEIYHNGVPIDPLILLG